MLKKGVNVLVSRNVGKILAELEELLIELGYPENKVCELMDYLEARIDDMECLDADEDSGE